jgi:hypothetical protein
VSAGPKLRTAAGKVKSFGTLLDAPNSVGSDNTLLMLQGDFSVTPPAGALALAPGPALAGAAVRVVPSGSLVLTTNRSYSDQIDVIALALTGAAPTVSSGTGVVSPAAGALALAGSGPTLGTSEAPVSVALTLTGAAPSLVRGTSIAPSPGAMSVAGIAPIDGLAEAPAAAALTISGVAPALVRGTIIQPSSGALAVGSSAPQQNAGLTPATASLTFAGAAPSVNGQQTLTPPAGQIVAAGAASSVLLPTTITPGAGAIATSGNAPALAQGQKLTPAQGALAIAGFVPPVGLQCSPGAAALGVVGAAPAVGLTIAKQPTSGLLLTSGFAPSIARTANSLATPASGLVGIVGYVPTSSRSSASRGVAGLARGGDGSLAPFAEFYHAAGEVLRYGIDWTYWLARLRPSAVAVAPGLVVRPSVPNGYQYVCALGGVTQSIEPTWPAMPGASLLDGTVLWTAQPIDTTSLTASVVSIAWTTTGPLVLTGSSLLGQLALVLVDATGAISGNDYDVLCTAMMTNGPPLSGKLRIKVR